MKTSNNYSNSVQFLGSELSIQPSSLAEHHSKSEKSCKCGGKSKKCKSKSASSFLRIR
jgi:hypothetical protein